MDFLKKFAEEATTKTETKPEGPNVTQTENNAANNALGGGNRQMNEDALDKAIDFVQERVFKQGSQANESAADQTFDDQIASAIRTGYKTVSGKDFPISDK